MKTSRHWKLAITLALVFAAGGIVGSVVTTLAIKRAFERSVKFENWTSNVMAHLEKRLKLTSEQTPKVRAIVDDMGKQLRSTFSKTVEESGHILVQSGKRIDQELTAEQRALHAEMKQKFRAQLKKCMDVDLPEE